MAGFITKIGNLPIYDFGFLIGNPSSASPINYDSYGFTWTYPNMFGDTAEDALRMFKGFCVQLSCNQGETILSLPLKSDTQGTTLDFFVDVVGQYFGTTSTVPNAVTGVGAIEAGYVQNSANWYNNQHTNLCGIPVYNNNNKDILTGIMVTGLILSQTGELAGTETNWVTISINYFRARGFEFVIESTSEEFGPASQPAGYTNPPFDHSSDVIGIPDKPTISVTTAGFYHAYKVTQGLLQNFGAKLFPSIGNIVGGITGINDTKDVLEVLTNFLISPALFTSTQIAGQNISVIDMILNGKAIDYVVDCHVIPVSPSVGGSQNIKCGAREIDISAPVITEDYIDFECGSISIPENFQNYLDYTGTRAKLFLVGVGFVDIKPEFWNGGTLSVKYRFNILDGSFMCYVSSTSGKSNLSNTVIGQYGGCMCLHIPVTGVSYASMISGLVTGSMSLAGNLASGNAAGAVGSALTVANSKPSLAQSNNYNSSTAFLGVRRPYLQIERQVPSFSTRYNIEQGLPLNVAMSLGALTGFTIIENPQLNLTCDDDEREEIYKLLQSGVIF